MEAITLERYQWLSLMEDCVEAGAMKALIATGAIKANITKAEAYRRYSRRKVDGWEREGLLTPIKNGEKNARVEYDLMTLDTLNKSTMRHAYLTIIKK